MVNIRELVYKKLKGLTKNKIDDTSNIYALGVDSLDFIEVVTDIEEEFGIHISDDDLAAIKTVAEVIKTFEIALKDKKDE